MDPPCGKDRPRGANWTSPIVMREQGREIVALQSKDGISAIEASSGEEIWSFEGGASTIPSSAWSGQGFVLVPSNGLTALKANSTGERPEQIWNENKLKPGTGSLTVVKDKVHAVNSANDKLRQSRFRKNPVALASQRPGKQFSGRHLRPSFPFQ